MEFRLIRSTADALLEPYTGRVRHFDRYDYVIGLLGPFSIRLWHDEIPDQAARVAEFERQARAHAEALARLPQ